MTTHTAEPAIVIDGVFFQLNSSGIARLWYEILTRWQEMEIGRRVVVLDRGGSLPKFEKLQSLVCPAFDYGAWQQDRQMLQDICDQAGAGLFMSTYYTRPERTPAALLIYDMIPERLEVDLSHAMWQQKHDAIRHAASFGAISQNTLSDLHALFPETADKPAILALPGVNASFFPPSADEQKQFHEQFVVPALGGRRYLMFVGDDSHYKNVGLLYRALQGIPPSARDKIGLLLTHEGLAPAFRELPGLKVHAGRLSDLGLRLAYGSANALIYPSLYEGFGLPALEAMACGCPVICTHVSSLPEVVGDAALFTDPDDERELRSNLQQLQVPALRESLRQKGLERAKLFSWDKMAAAVADLANSALAGINKFTSPPG